LTAALLFTAVATTAIAAPSPSDTIPGVDRALPLSLSDSLSTSTHVFNVSRIHLDAGQMLKAGLTSDPGTDFFIALLSSAATGTQDFNHFVGYSISVGTSAQSFNYEAPSAGYFSLEAYMHTLVPGNFALSAAVVPQRVSSLSGPSSVKAGKWIYLSGYVTPMHNGAKDTTIYWERKVRGKWKAMSNLKFAPMPQAGTDRSVFTFKYKGPKNAMRFRAAHKSGPTIIYSPWKSVTVK
jgi:hypothetical protein